MTKKQQIIDHVRKRIGEERIIAEFKNEYGEEYIIYELKIDENHWQLFIAGDETAWESYTLVSDKLAVKEFYFNDEESKKLKDILTSYGK